MVVQTAFPGEIKSDQPYSIAFNTSVDLNSLKENTTLYQVVGDMLTPLEVVDVKEVPSYGYFYEFGDVVDWLD